MRREHALALRTRLTGRMRRAVRYRGMLVLVLWQAPVQPVVRPDGSLGIMIGGGSDEHAELNCSGDLVRSDRVRHRVAALEADYDVSRLVHVDAAAGLMSSDHASHDGAFGTVRLRADWKYVGVGAGAAVGPAFDEFDGGSTVWPSVYLRGGSADGFHARAEAFPPTAFAAQQIARIGLGYNAVLRDRPSGFIGLAGVGSNEGATGVAGELTIPVASRFAVRMEGYYAGGHAHPVAGFAAGGRLLVGGKPPGRASLTLPATGGGADRPLR